MLTYNVRRNMDLLKGGFRTFLEAALWAKRNTDGIGVWFEEVR